MLPCTSSHAMGLACFGIDIIWTYATKSTMYDLMGKYYPILAWEDHTLLHLLLAHVQPAYHDHQLLTELVPRSSTEERKTCIAHQFHLVLPYSGQDCPLMTTTVLQWSRDNRKHHLVHPSPIERFQTVGKLPHTASTIVMVPSVNLSATQFPKVLQPLETVAFKGIW
jgi:hypothetical protein